MGAEAALGIIKQFYLFSFFGSERPCEEAFAALTRIFFLTLIAKYFTYKTPAIVYGREFDVRENESMKHATKKAAKKAPAKKAAKKAAKKK